MHQKMFALAQAQGLTPVEVGMSPDTHRPLFMAPDPAFDADGKTIRLSFNEIAAYIGKANEQAYLGHTDWRLASNAEWDLMIEEKKKTGMTPPRDELGVPSRHFWTSTPYESYSYYIHCESGKLSWGHGKMNALVWLVRS